MRFLFIMLLVLAVGVGAYFLFRTDGVLERVTQARVEQALVANGAPGLLADCMAERLVDDLTIGQLRKLEALAPREGEDRVPRSTRDALDRLERVDDPQAVRVLVASGARCSFSVLRNEIGGS